MSEELILESIYDDMCITEVGEVYVEEGVMFDVGQVNISVQPEHGPGKVEHRGIVDARQSTDIRLVCDIIQEGTGRGGSVVVRRNIIVESINGSEDLNVYITSGESVDERFKATHYYLDELTSSLDIGEELSGELNIFKPEYV